MPFGSVVVKIENGVVLPVRAYIPWEEIAVDEAVAVESREPPSAQFDEFWACVFVSLIEVVFRRRQSDFR